MRIRLIYANILPVITRARESISLHRVVRAGAMQCQSLNVVKVHDIRIAVP